jgi:hypothetical protein
MDPVSWTSHPLRDESRQKSACLICIILGTAFIIGWSFQSTPLGCLSFALLMAAMSRYFLPTHYTCGENEISISHIGHRRSFSWTLFARADQHPDGIFLSPFRKAHRLDTFRGHFLKTGAQTREIFHVVQQHLQDGSF